MRVYTGIPVYVHRPIRIVHSRSKRGGFGRIPAFPRSTAIPRHDVKRYFKLFPHLRLQRPTPNHVTTHFSNSRSWIVDSSASHHVTSQFSDFSLQQRYENPDDIVIGDGSGLKSQILAIFLFLLHLLYQMFHVSLLLNKILDRFLNLVAQTILPLNFFLLILLSMIYAPGYLYFAEKIDMISMNDQWETLQIKALVWLSLLVFTLKSLLLCGMGN